MTWHIGDEDAGVTLPYGPNRLDRKILRKQAAEQILEDFPLPFDLGPDSFELQMNGLIHPASEADKLYEIAKRAETASIIITNDEADFQKFNGQYAVSRGSISISSPQRDATTGGLVQNFSITFVQFTEQSDTGNGDSGENSGDEEGIGFGDFDFSFSDLILDSFQNLFPNLFA